MNNDNNDNEEHVAIVEQRQEYCHMVLFEGWGGGEQAVTRKFGSFSCV
jgi:hypothetical protein